MSKEKDVYQLIKEQLELKKLQQEVDFNELMNSKKLEIADLRIRLLNLQVKTFIAGLVLTGLLALAKIIDMMFF
jgi:hypothetical protein